MRMGALLAAMALACGGTAQAQGCWDQRAVEAAQIRQFDRMLMVAALRCQAQGVDFVSDYSAFVRRYRPVLAVAADELRGHAAPSVEGEVAPGACDALRDMVIAAAVPPSRDAILGLARRAGMAPVPTVESCDGLVGSGRGPEARQVATVR